MNQEVYRISKLVPIKKLWLIYLSLIFVVDILIGLGFNPNFWVYIIIPIALSVFIVLAFGQQTVLITMNPEEKLIEIHSRDIWGKTSIISLHPKELSFYISTDANRSGKTRAINILKGGKPVGNIKIYEEKQEIGQYNKVIEDLDKIIKSVYD